MSPSGLMHFSHDILKLINTNKHKEVRVMMFLTIIGYAAIIFTIVMVVNFKKHPKLTIMTILTFVASLLMICPDIVWIILIALTIINGQRQKRLAA